MPKKVNQLASIEQLHENGTIFQLGAGHSGHCTVLFGLSSIDEDKTRRTIKISVNVNDLTILRAYDKENDDLQDVVKDTATGAVNVKVDMKTTKVTGGSLVDLTQDVQCDMIVKLTRWSMNGQQGISFRCLALKIIEEDYEFLD